MNAKNTCKTNPWRQGETFRLHHKRTCRLLAPNVEAHTIRSTALQCAIYEGFQVCQYNSMHTTLVPLPLCSAILLCVLLDPKNVAAALTRQHLLEQSALGCE